MSGHQELEVFFDGGEEVSRGMLLEGEPAAADGSEAVSYFECDFMF